MQDEILYCGRCGISFLWAQEEQRSAADGGAPHYCSACRLLLPPAGRERGLVKWYNSRKQYGFLVRAGQPDIYVHRSGVLEARQLRPGDLVEFAVDETSRGPSAIEVTVVVPAT
jgi:cold shock protein